MRVTRGASQVLFGFLPMQTADLDGRIWRVSEWVDAIALPVDKEAVRSALSVAVSRWTTAGQDDSLAGELARKADLDVVAVNPDRGVRVEEYPRLWRCRHCRRVTKTAEKCACGGTSGKVQLTLVQYHACGAQEEPWVPSCRTHHAIALERTGTTKLSEQRFFCPVCNQTVSWGFIPRQCKCGAGYMNTNVHRAASVYTPHFVVVVNPPDPAAAARMRAAGGGARALDWALDGMAETTPFSGKQSVAGLIDMMVKTGISAETATRLAAQAAEAGEVSDPDSAGPSVDGIEILALAQEEALSLATAVEAGRITLADLIRSASPPLRSRYEAGYRTALSRARLEAVDFLPTFPVLTVSFGYSRDHYNQNVSRLVPFRDRGRLRLHGALGRTEALLFRLDAMAVEAWLRARGCLGPDKPSSPREARVKILNALSAASPIADDVPDADNAVYQLLHSYAHRTIRRLSAFAGIERDSLSEYLLPSQLAFVVYAAAKGDFVLGGLQAVFETTLDTFLADLVDGEARCPLDPGCRSGGGACMACLHLGEPSCRWFNRRLDRATLFGPKGYVR